MAVAIGTNSGFVTAAPTVNPGGTATVIDTYALAIKDTSPSTAAKITTVGWWCDTATEASNFEVGLYAADGTDGAPSTLLYSATTNAKGTNSGFKNVTVDWAISPSTAYWIAVQLDNTSTTTRTDLGVGTATDLKSSVTTLPSPFNSSGPVTGQTFTIYAVWEASAKGKINIGDTWKDVADIKINIGDSWKTVSSIKINIGDSWKTVF